MDSLYRMIEKVSISADILHAKLIAKAALIPAICYIAKLLQSVDNVVY